MRRVKGKDTTPELEVRRLLTRMGLRYRLHRADLPGKPDIVMPGRKLAIFVHGCFWHGHDCRLFKWPQTRPEFWRDKIGRNRSNDEKSRAALLAAGWRVAVVWECALRGANRDLDGVLQRLIDWLHSDVTELEERS